MCPVCGAPSDDDAIIVDIVSEEDLIALAVAIRRGDREGAEVALDRIAGDVGNNWSHLIEVARYSPPARRAA